MVILFSLVSLKAFSVPFSFPFEQIPFGKSVEEVLQLVEGADINENSDSISVSFISEFSLSLLKGGLYSYFGMGTYLSEKCAKSITLTSPEWENLESIVLYFTNTYGKNDYTLMMVKKTQKRPDAKYDNVYAGMKNSIIKSLNGQQPREFQERWATDQMRYQGTYDYGLIARWTVKSKDIYLLIHNDWISCGKPELVYVDQLQAAKYLSSTKEYETQKKKAEESKSTADF